MSPALDPPGDVVVETRADGPVGQAADDAEAGVLDDDEFVDGDADELEDVLEEVLEDDSVVDAFSVEPFFAVAPSLARESVR